MPVKQPLVLSLVLLLFIAATLLPATNTPPRGSGADSKPGTNRRPFSSAFLDQYRYRYRNPFLAGLLSSGMWGTGQIYCGEYKTGSLLVFGDLVYKGLLIGILLKLNNKYSTGGSDSVRWAELSAADKGLVIGYAVSWLGITLLSISDAVESAHRFNRANDLKKRFSLGFSADGGTPSLLLGWNLPF